METFEFTVISTANVYVIEKVKIEANSYEDAVDRIQDRDYYEEDGEILDSKFDAIEYQEVVDILDPEYFGDSNNNLTEEKPLWTSEY